MPAAVLFPRYDHPAIEERYASWQAERLLAREAIELHHYDLDETARHAVQDVDASHVLVVTDPLLLASPRLAERLSAMLGESNAFAALPSSTQSAHAAQRSSLPAYMTLREFEMETTALQQLDSGVERLTWDDSDPGAFLCASENLSALKVPLPVVLKGREVVISRADFIHRWASLRGDKRQDLDRKSVV